MTEDTFDAVDHLPIMARREEILAAVRNQQVTIITAETGAGKSTQVPQFLLAAGYQKIIVTQPRILAARNLSERVRQEVSWRQGADCTDIVSYRTAHERDDGDATRILYCTDGLQLVRELAGSGTSENQVLILDEVHEWNENMEVLVAWSKKRCQEDPSFKLVLMSATIDSSSLADYYHATTPLAITGRSYPVENVYSDDLINAIVDYAARPDPSILVFLPGKAEIELVRESLALQLPATITVLPLHSQLDPAEQQLAFQHYQGGKVILSTNIAQTSVTIDDITVVIDSGLERRAEVRNGVEGLFIAEVSQADCLQRAGRAGRVQAGTYVLTRLGTLPCPPLVERPLYGIPEIMRKHIDRLVLRLANIQLDIEDLEFYHSPSRKTIKQAKQTLISLGAITPHQQVTAIGRRMERFPVESSFARMLVAAQALPVPTQAKVAAIIAIQEVGGIIRGGPRYTQWRRFTKQQQSDLIAQFEVYLALDTIDEATWDDVGIIGKNVSKAIEVFERLAHDLGLADAIVTPIAADELAPILRCLVAGQLHQLWLIDEQRQAVSLFSGLRRELSSTSVVKNAALVAGTPFDLQIPGERGLETLHLVNQLTAVMPEWLADLAPDRFAVKAGKAYYDPRFGSLAERTILQTGGQEFETASSPVLDHTPENQKRFITQYSVWVLAQLDQERQQLQQVNKRRIPAVQLRQIEQQVRFTANGAVSMLELSKKQRLELARLTKLETLLGQKIMNGFARPGPHQKRRTGFKHRWHDADRMKHHDRRHR